MSKKILIVDNEPEMLLLLSRLITENTPYKPVVTNIPMEALELVRQGGIDLVVAEMKIPGLDGLELLSAVRRINKETPVIIMAAYGTVESAIETMRKGGFDYIAKPFRKERILYAINNALKFRGLIEENMALKQCLNKAKEPALAAAAGS